MTISNITPNGAVAQAQRHAGSDGASASDKLVQDGAAASSASGANASDAAPTPREQLDSVVATMQGAMQSINRDINFQVDDSSGRVVVKVVDGSSGDVVRQIPSEEALELASRLEDMRSLLFSEQA